MKGGENDFFISRQRPLMSKEDNKRGGGGIMQLFPGLVCIKKALFLLFCRTMLYFLPRRKKRKNMGKIPHIWAFILLSAAAFPSPLYMRRFSFSSSVRPWIFTTRRRRTIERGFFFRRMSVAGVREINA